MAKKPEKKAATKQNLKPINAEALFTREEIQASPSVLKTTPEVLAGAMATLKGDKFTRSQVVNAIENFKKRKV